MANAGSLKEALKIVDAARREAVLKSVLAEIGGSIKASADLIAERNRILERRLNDFLGNLRLDKLGAIDPAAPQNAPLLSALRTDLDAFAAETSAALAGLVGSGMARFTREAAPLWADAAKGRAIVLASLPDSVGRIQRLSADGMAQVFERWRNAIMVGGQSTREVNKQIAEVTGRALAQAEQLTHDALFGGYRQANLADGNELGADRFHMVGPVDDRITPICFKHVGRIKSRAEWQEIRADVFRYGLHHRCRHQWLPVSEERYLRLVGQAGYVPGDRLLYSASARKLASDVDDKFGGDFGKWFAKHGGKGTKGGEGLRRAS